MPFAITVDIEEQDGRIRVEHTFFGETEREARSVLDAHLRTCPYFRAAEAQGRTIESVEEIDEDDWPSPDDDDDEGDDDEEDGEEDENEEGEETL